MPKHQAPHICFDRILPENLDPNADQHKVAVSKYVSVVKDHAKKNRKEISANAPFAEHVEAAGGVKTLSATDGPIAPLRMALINLKKWPDGQTLSCTFLDGDSTQQEKVIENAKIWETYANIKLDFGNDPEALIRISFKADPGSWSAVGTDCKVTEYFPKDQPTMNFGWLDDETEDKEYERVVVHEFGHALGCIHEHQSPKEHLKWDKQAVYKAFSGPPNNWSKAEIDHNILQKYSPAGISATSFDEQSIMLYQFDGSLFTDGKGTPLNYELSNLDKRMINTMYSKPSGVRKTA